MTKPDTVSLEATETIPTPGIFTFFADAVPSLFFVLTHHVVNSAYSGGLATRAGFLSYNVSHLPPSHLSPALRCRGFDIITLATHCCIIQLLTNYIWCRCCAGAIGHAMMGFNDLDESVTASADETAPTDTDINDHGLHFLNEEWNGSIANGQSFMLRWNDSIEEGQGDLRLFKIHYPEHGVVSFELVSNLTEGVDGASCVWTPDGLSDSDLYALWVRRDGAVDQQWAISPPWKIDEEDDGFHWTNPIGIPIVVILGVYFISLATCLLYRRRRHKKRDQERRPPITISAPIPCDDRHPSVSSVVTVESLTEEDALVKKHSNDGGRTWIVVNPGQQRRWETQIHSSGWTSPTSTLRESEQTSPTRPSPPRGVEWNTLNWRSEERAESGGEPMIRRQERPWGHDWDEGPIGVAH